MAATQKVSFTVRRPTPVSRATSSGAESDNSSSFKVPSLPRHLANSNDSTPGSPLARSTTASPRPDTRGTYDAAEPDPSDEDDDQLQDELVTGFDKFGVQRLHKDKKAKQGPLVIPALKNRDWKELARKRRAHYVPPSAKAQTGADGSVGGLGTRDSINSGPVLSGLQLKKPPSRLQEELNGAEREDAEEYTDDVKMKDEEETEDQKALRAILAGVDGTGTDGPVIDIIPTPISEADAYKQDVDELPDVATLEDYTRVPVSQFGAALLRGMGWKEGTAASRKPGKGLIEPYLPEARPALLGIGAKEQEVYDDGSNRKAGAKKRPDRRYIPVVKKEKEGTPSSGPGERDKRNRSRSPRRTNGSTSRRSSRSPGRDRSPDRERESRHKDRGDGYRNRDRERARDYDYKRYDSDRDRSRRSSSRRGRDH